MADAVLSVEVRAKLDQLSKGLGTAEKSIEDFVNKGDRHISVIEQRFQNLGKSTKEIAENIKSSFGGISLDKFISSTYKSGEAIEASKAEAEKWKSKIIELKSAHQDLKNQLESNNKAIADSRLKTEDSKKATQKHREEVAKNAEAISKLRLAQAQNKKETQAASGSYRESQQRLTALGKALRESEGGFDLNNKAIRKQIAEYSALNSKLKQYDAAMGNYQRSVGNYGLFGALGKGVNSASNGIASATGAMQGVASLFLPMALSFTAASQAIVSGNLEISDSLSDLQRTAELTKKESYELVDALKALPTRTGLKDLIDIGTIGGQLGIAKGELVGFIQALDFLGVALAKEIPGGAEAIAESLGKVNGVFKIAQKEGITAGEAMQKTGSAILALGQAGLATGGFLVDFTQRVGGSASIAKIALPSILAYGATLEEAGISAEVAGTAVGKLIGELAKKREDFFAVAQIGDASLTLEKFTNLINTDAEKALNKFFVGLKSGGSTLTSFYDILAGAGIKSERYTNAILAIANNQERLNELTALGTKEYENGSKAAEQAAIRNLNLAGVTDQLGRSIKEAFIDSERSQSLATWLAQTFDLINTSKLLAYEVNENKSSLTEYNGAVNDLVARYKDLLPKSLSNKDAHEDLRGVIQQLGEIMPGAVTQWDNYGMALDVNIGKVNQLTDAHRKLIREANSEAIEKIGKSWESNVKQAEEAQKKFQRIANGNATMWESFTGQDKSSKTISAQKNLSALQDIEALKQAGVELSKQQQSWLDGFNKSSKTSKKNADAIKEVAKDVANSQTKIESSSKTKKTKTNNEPERLKKERKSLEDILISSIDSVNKVELKGIAKTRFEIDEKYNGWIKKARESVKTIGDAAETIKQLEINKVKETYLATDKIMKESLEKKKKDELKSARDLAESKKKITADAISIDLVFARKFDETSGQRSLRQLNAEYKKMSEILEKELKSQAESGLSNGVNSRESALQDEYYKKMEVLHALDNKMRVDMTDGRNIFNKSLEKTNILLDENTRKMQDVNASDPEYKSKLEEFQKYQTALLNQQETLNTLKGAYDQLTEGIGSSFANMLIKGESFAKGMEDVFRSMVSSIISQLVKLAAVKILGGIATGGIGSIFSGLFGGFASGGYTGNVGVNTPAGVVHGQEYVVNAQATKQFRPLLESINSGKIPSVEDFTPQLANKISQNPSLGAMNTKNNVSLSVKVDGDVRNNVIKLSNNKATRRERKIGRG